MPRHRPPLSRLSRRTTLICSECGLIEAGSATFEEWRVLIKRQAGFFYFDPDCGEYCMVTVPAWIWRSMASLGLSCQLVA